MNELIALVAMVLQAFLSGIANDTPPQYELEYVLTCEPLYMNGDADGHDDCVSHLLDKYDAWL